MNLQPGTQLRQYQIIETIGAGGMGEVYSARDTNLERDVAIKVLPKAMASKPLNLARLEREAKAIAALSHPNILAVYDFGTEDDIAFVVVELLEGETLRDAMAHGAIPARKVTEIGRQIARGLAAAHDKGIVHRDLKPENVFLTHAGRVKILDFGLATAGDDNETADGDTVLMGATKSDLTAPGTVLGTVDYMSPEQVRGQATDNRSDLFSMGSVLYEMASGTRPFHRDTAPETMTAILKDEPTDLASRQPDIPPALAAIIRRCLEKRPGERFHSAHDLAFSLEALSGSSVSTGTAKAITDVAEPRRRPGLAMTGLLVLLGLLIGAGAATLLRPAVEEPSPLEFTFLSLRRGTVTNARFVGNDGDVVYSATWEGGPLQLYPASASNLTADPLKIENAHLLSVSSSGAMALSLDYRQTVGFETIGTLAIAQPGGAAPRPILENVMNADWAPDGQSLAVAVEDDGRVRLEYPVGTVIYDAPGWISSVSVHPDGQQVLISDCPGRGDNASFLKIIKRDGSVETLGIGGSWGAMWALDGESILFSHGNRLYRIRPGGERTLIYSAPSAFLLQDMDENGLILASAATSRREMNGLAPGSQAEISLSWLDWSTPRVLSNDGNWAVFEEGNQFNDDGYAIYMRGTDGSAPSLLGYGWALALSPDNKHLAVGKRLFGDDQELVIMTTGPGQTRKVPLGNLRIFSNDGDWIPGTDPEDPGALALPGRLPDGVKQLFHIPLGGSGTPRAITPADMPLGPQGHIVSPDGKRVIVKPNQGTAVAFDIDGSGPFSVPGIEPGELPLEFDDAGRYFYVLGSGVPPAPIYRIDLESGARELWHELSPGDPAGVQMVDRVQISADGSAYIYSCRRVLSSLVTIAGLE